MANTFRHYRGAAIFDIELASRQLILRVTGPLTAGVVVYIANDVDRIAKGMLARSIVLDYSRAAVAVSVEEMHAGPRILSPEIRSLPVALVPPAGLEELFREFAYEAAMSGLVRGVFPVESAPARAWALQKEGRCPGAGLRSGIREAALSGHRP